MNRAFDDPVTRDLHDHAFKHQQDAHRLRVALINAAASGDVSREDRRVRHHVESSVMIVDLIASLCAGFLAGLLTAWVLLRWM